MAKRRRPSEMEVFLAAIEYADPDLRRAYLEVVCRNNARLRSSVERLLQHHFRTDGILETPAVNVERFRERRTRTPGP